MKDKSLKFFVFKAFYAIKTLFMSVILLRDYRKFLSQLGEAIELYNKKGDDIINNRLHKNRWKILLKSKKTYLSEQKDICLKYTSCMPAEIKKHLNNPDFFKAVSKLIESNKKRIIKYPSAIYDLVAYHFYIESLSKIKNIKQLEKELNLRLNVIKSKLIIRIAIIEKAVKKEKAIQSMNH